MKIEGQHIQRAEVDNNLFQKGLKLLKQVREKLLPDQTPPEYDPRETARQKAEEFAQYLSDHPETQTINKPFLADEVINFNKIISSVPIALRFDFNLSPGIKSVRQNEYQFLIVIMEDNHPFIFHPIQPEVVEDSFIFRLHGNGVQMLDLTDAFGDEITVSEFGRILWTGLTKQEADIIEDTRRVDPINAGYSQKIDAKERQAEQIGFPAWQS